MKITAPLFSGYRCEWQIRIVPRRDSKTVTRRWKSDAGSEMLIYNPLVSIVLKNRDNFVALPIHMAYMLEDTVSVVYHGLGTKGLYKKDGFRLYMDAKISENLTHKLSCYHTSLVIRPAVVECGDEDVYGIDLFTNGNLVGTMRIDEVRPFCEVLSHLDVSTFSMIAMMAEQISSIDDKLDNVIATQAQILQALKGQIPYQKQQPDMQWSRVV